jgi:hypothetical protein
MENQGNMEKVHGTANVVAIILLLFKSTISFFAGNVSGKLQRR